MEKVFDDDKEYLRKKFVTSKFSLPHQTVSKLPNKKKTLAQLFFSEIPRNINVEERHSSRRLRTIDATDEKSTYKPQPSQFPLLRHIEVYVR
jgi:hypothetical protein